MCWNQMGTLANPFSHSRRPATLLVQPLSSSRRHSQGGGSLAAREWEQPWSEMGTCGRARLLIWDLGF